MIHLMNSSTSAQNGVVSQQLGNLVFVRAVDEEFRVLAEMLVEYTEPPHTLCNPHKVLIVSRPKLSERLSRKTLGVDNVLAEQ